MQIGIIGLGDMGKLYAKAFAQAGYDVCGVDIAELIEGLQIELEPFGIEVLQDGHQVTRKSDFIIFCVEAERIDEVVAYYAKSIKYAAIVSGQTSVKHPEILAFEKYLSHDVQIVSCHSLHGPAFETAGQTLIVIRHRASNEKYMAALKIFKALKSQIIEMDDYRVHDKIMADTQAITHMGFESMGSAWKNAGFYPWENAAYSKGIDNVKILITLRIFSYKAHIYAGLAILNPYARKQVKVYAKAESELFKLMISENEKEFRERIYKARDFLFKENSTLIMLDDSVMEEFSLANGGHQTKPNSHLSILSMVYSWYMMKINPYDNLICQTPPFRLRLGIAEYLFKNEKMLEESIQAALYDKTIRCDDLEFHTAVHEWASIIGYGDLNGYKEHFEAAKTFFTNRVEGALQLSSEMIKKLAN
ncbi:prephenate dehydrogenase [Pedobacter polaris]|uniref:Prephenate dehydrogenase n=1 Tax=Pedobacter polaris TaxID=2571273 RepID=A0A4U1CG24_9SPHI|nr:prephenate dehydrogenase [Pedobacter polaris]TKC05421.1 prephenate dehydrogenase [Pedobacter polaris]